MKITSLRIANLQDCKNIFQLINELGYNLKYTEFKKCFLKILKSKHHGILVAKNVSSIVGFLSYSFKLQLRLGGMSMEIDELIVCHSHRGQRIGFRLLKHANKIARNLHIKRVTLSTNRERESYKRGFYLKSGFKEVNSALFRKNI